MKNKTKHGLVTGLTALSTAMICQTSMTYASDIEIYKAPTTGGAHIMMVLDLSSSMSQEISNMNPVNKDFFESKSCTKENRIISTHLNNQDYSFTGTFCYIYGSTSRYNRTQIVETYIETQTQTKTGRNWSPSVLTSTTPIQTPNPLSNQPPFTNVYNSLNNTSKNKINSACLHIVDESTGTTGSKTTNAPSWPSANSGWSTSGNTRRRSRTVTVTYPTTYNERIEIYSCPDRLTMLRKSLYELIAGNSTVNNTTTTITPLPDTTYLGFTTFPNNSSRNGTDSMNVQYLNPRLEQTPIILNDVNRAALVDGIASWAPSHGTPISWAYAKGAKGLIDYIANPNSESSCAGYGVYFLTDGEPQSDDVSRAASTIKSPDNDRGSSSDPTNKSFTCGAVSSWECVKKIAEPLYLKNHKEKVEIKTAIVGFGADFSFKKNNVIVPFAASNITEFTSGTNQRRAAEAALAGGGGWYSADDSIDISNSVQNFVESIKIPIPAITTGTAAIPQDRLNPIVIQSYAYFPQFQPKPSEDFEAWFGNLKKFSVKDGVLVGQDDEKVFGADGALKSATKDFWVNGASADWAAYGGLLSKLNLQTFTNGTDFARKVFTNAGGSIQKVNLEYMQEKIATGNNKYLLGALGYDLTETELDELAALDSLELTNLANRKQNRSIGAIMHSTPVLLTQSGKITYSDTKKSNETVDRDDYILFGTTQGALHVVKTGREADTYANDETPADYDGGKEIFTFIPEEMLVAQPKALLSEPNTEGNGMDQLYYGIDGAWTAHTEYVYNTTSDKFEVNPSSGKKGKQWVYGGMRMGGSSYYALDLTDIDQPKIKFRIDPESGKVYKTNDISGTAYGDLSKMGQSWSKPTIAYVQWKGQRKLVMLVGGGYDPQYEDFTAGKTTKGAGVYMFDADTGDLLWSTYDASGGDKSRLEYSVVSQIKAVDREGDGDVDHLYFGDLGGQVFRIDLKSNHSSSDAKADFAKITRLADFKETGKYAPRFYEMPAFSIYRNATGMFVVLSIGSGNRSTPLLGKVIDSQYVTPDESDTENQKLLNDAIYNIYDLAVTDKNPANSTKGPLSIGRSNLQQITDEDRELASDEDQAGEDYNENSSYKGWYYEFPSSASIGNRKAVEKVQSDLVLLDSDLYVSTFDAEGVGSEEACGAGIYGSSRAHKFCMPYGQCGAGDTVEDNTMTLGKGLLGITLGQSTDTNGVPYRSIIGPVENRNPTSNKILNTLYRNKIKLTPYSWYERN